jgi:hypothetical protein
MAIAQAQEGIIQRRRRNLGHSIRAALHPQRTVFAGQINRRFGHDCFSKPNWTGKFNRQSEGTTSNIEHRTNKQTNLGQTN